MTRRVYAPIHLINKRPYGRALRALVEGRHPDVAAELRRHGCDDAADMGDSGPTAPLSLITSRAYTVGNDTRNAGAFFDEMMTILPLYAFADAGSRIVQFDAALTTEFHHTDVDGMTLDDMDLPWESLYLAFDGPDAPARTGMPIDGALVTMTRPDPAAGIEGLLAIRPLMTPAEPWTTPDRQTTWTVMATGRDGKDLRTEFAESAGEVIGLASEFERTAPFEMDRERRDDMEAFRRNQMRSPAMLEALVNLAVNALLYLSQRPSLIEGWQPGAPAKLLERAAIPGRQGEKASRELTYAGWARIHHLGVPAQGDGHFVRAHWRRGHWRRQAHGPRMSLRRLVRIAPMLVGGDRGEANRQHRVVRIDAKGDGA